MSRILLLYTDPYYCIKQVYPFGLDLIGESLRKKGHEVSLCYPYLPHSDLRFNLEFILSRFKPDFIGLGIRNIDTTMACEQFGNYEGPGFRTYYFIPQIKNLVQELRLLLPQIPIIVGGGGFSVSPQTIFKVLGADFGLVGEGEQSFCCLVDFWPDISAIKDISGLVYEEKNKIYINSRAKYNFDFYPQNFIRAANFKYALENTAIPVQLKRGCNQNCCFCVEPGIEGRGFTFRSIFEVIAELHFLGEQYPQAQKIFFVDTEFNIPNEEYCIKLARAIIADKLHKRFYFATQMLPRPFSKELAEVLFEAGFSLIFTCDSFADSVLEQNGMSYRRQDIVHTLKLTQSIGINCTIDLIFGLPGEGWESIQETCELMRQFPAGSLLDYEYTIGARIYNNTPLSQKLPSLKTEHIHGQISEQFLQPCFYCSPEAPLQMQAKLEKFIPYPVSFANKFESNKNQKLAVYYLADQQSWQETATLFFSLQIEDQIEVYPYLFRVLAEGGQGAMAFSLSEFMLEQIIGSGLEDRFVAEVEMIKMNLMFLS